MKKMISIILLIVVLMSVGCTNKNTVEDLSETQLKELGSSLFTDYLESLTLDSITDDTRIKDYKINKLEIVDKDKNTFKFSVNYSVLPATDKWILAGSGVFDENGWVVERFYFVDVEKKGNDYKIINMGTGL